MRPVVLDELGLPVGYPFQSAWEVAPRQVQAMRAAGEPFLMLDCRLAWEVEAARIEDASWIPMQALPDRLAELEDAAEGKVVVFCHAGVRSMRVAGFLREHGFADVWSMAGGIDLWSLGVDPSVPRY